MPRTTYRQLRIGLQLSLVPKRDTGSRYSSGLRSNPEPEECKAGPAGRELQAISPGLEYHRRSEAAA